MDTLDELLAWLGLGLGLGLGLTLTLAPLMAPLASEP